MINISDDFADVKRVEAFIDKLPVQPDPSGLIELSTDNGNKTYRYYVENDIHNDKLLIFEPIKGIKHVVYRSLREDEKLKYAATPDGRVFYSNNAPGSHRMFINRLLRLNILSCFDPNGFVAGCNYDPICYLGADTDHVVFSDDKNVIKAASDGTETVLFEAPYDSDLYQYLDRDHIFVFHKSIHNKVKYCEFYDETGKLLDGPTDSSRVLAVAGYLVKLIIDEDSFVRLIFKRRRKAEQKVADFLENGFEEDTVTYNVLFSMINACTQAHVVTDHKLRNNLVKVLNFYIQLGISADVFTMAFFDIYNHYDDLNEEMVSCLEKLANDTSLSFEERRAIAANADKFIKYKEK
ncbi:MAG: hypothetical protein J5585_01565 [Clostridia bacterium]|nr:hypothetical protein [Clostridia bacterium]